MAIQLDGTAYDTHVTPLRNPINDARDMAQSLQGLGFHVKLLTDATRPQMDAAVVHLENELANSKTSVGFFYYAGHGVQRDGTNYLIPVNADIPAAAFLSGRADSLQSILNEIGSAGNRLNVFVLDACRDNPFSWSRGLTRGLTVVGSQPPESIIAFAAGSGQVAQDGTGSHGVYTAQLLKHLRTPGTNITDMFAATGGAVSAKTDGSQNPALYSQFYGTFYLAGAPSSQQEAVAPAATSQQGSAHETGIHPSLKLLSTLNLEPNERVDKIVASGDGSAYVVVTSVETGILVKKKIYYVRQGSKRLGPFTSFTEQEKGSWVATGSHGRYYVGSPWTVIGPLSSDVTGIGWARTMADRRLAFIAKTKNDQEYLQLGETKGTTFGYIYDLTPSPDNLSIAYLAQRGNQFYEVTGSSVNGPYDYYNGYGSTLVWSPDGSVCAYAAQTGKDVYIYEGTTRIGPFGWVYELLFAPEGKTLVYIADDYIFAGKERLGPFVGPGRLVFSPHGNRFAFAGQKYNGGMEFVHLNNGKTYGPFYDFGLRYDFSPDGRTFFCRGIDASGDTVVYMGNQKTVIKSQYAFPIPVFSKQGRHDAFVVDTGSPSWQMNMKNKKLDVDPKLPYGILSDGTPLYWKSMNGGHYLVTGDLQQGPYEVITDVSTAEAFRFLVVQKQAVYLLSCPR